MNPLFKPHNPDNLPPPDPGYRYLAVGEILRDTDELFFKGTWTTTELTGRVIRPEDNTYRRALNVDDPSAPPPAEWVKPGYTVVKGPLPEEMWAKEYIHGWNKRDGWGSYYVGSDPELYYRYPTFYPIANPKSIDPTAMNSSSSPNPLTVKDDQSITIKVGNNQALSRAVQEIAFEAGWQWPGGTEPRKDVAISEDSCIGLHPGKRISFSPLSHYQNVYLNLVLLNARTDLGKLIDMLAEANKPKLPPVPKLSGPDNKVYEAAYAKGQSVISFGCAKICIGLLEDVAFLLNGVTPNKVSGAVSSSYTRASYIGNRNVKSVILDSGAVISGAEVKEILEYVYAVNAAK